MDENAIQHLPCEDDQNSLLKFIPTTYKNSSQSVEILKGLKKLHSRNELCDIEMETDDGSVVLGHKIVLASASPYFRAMFTSSEERDKSCINIKNLDSAVLELLVRYSYTGEIVITEKHVQGLLAAANLVQLNYIRAACVDFLQTQLDPSNCLTIRDIAMSNNCTELMSTTDAYIKKQFSDVVKCDEFLSLPLEEVFRLISCSDLTAFEETVFESVMIWIKHDLVCRGQYLPELLEHVKLPLISKQYLLQNVSEEPLLKNNPRCKDYVYEAINFQLLKSQQIITIAKTIRCKPRQPGGLQKVILILSNCPNSKTFLTNFYDPANNKCHTAVDRMKINFYPSHLVSIADQFVIAVGRIPSESTYCRSTRSIQILDLFSRVSSWVPMVNTLVDRDCLGIGVLNNSIYAIGGENVSGSLNCAEVFDINSQEWRMISNMSIRRSKVTVGVLNNLLYAVGGYDTYTSESLSSVECYDPSLDKWTQVAEMSRCRSQVSIGVLNGVMYVIDGTNNFDSCTSVEAYIPNEGIWTRVADLPIGIIPRIVVPIDGLLYVLSHARFCKNVIVAQIYNPNTNTWEIKEETAFNDTGYFFAGVGIGRLPHFKTD